MTTKRQLFHDYYAFPKTEGLHVFEHQGPERDRYRFRGDAMEHSIVVRVDLNGYPRWATEQTVASRIALAEDFLSRIVAALDRYGGLLYHDDTSGVLVLFSEYFGPGADMDTAIAFGAHLAEERYGRDGLDARVVIAAGSLTYFQRPHEVASDDWSAEGTALLRAAWLSQVVPARRCLHVYEDDFALSSPEACRDLLRRTGCRQRKVQVALPKQAGPRRMTRIVTIENRRPEPADTRDDDAGDDRTGGK